MAHPMQVDKLSSLVNRVTLGAFSAEDEPRNFRWDTHRENPPNILGPTVLWLMVEVGISTLEKKPPPTKGLWVKTLFILFYSSSAIVRKRQPDLLRWSWQAGHTYIPAPCVFAMARQGYHKVSELRQLSFCEEGSGPLRIHVQHLLRPKS